MNKRLVYALLKAKGYKVVVRYKLDNDGELNVVIDASKFAWVDRDKWISTMDFIRLSFYNDTLAYADFSRLTDHVDEERYSINMWENKNIVDFTNDMIIEWA